MPLTRDELVASLARVSHETWMRQKERDLRRDLEELPSKTEVADYDLERARDTVAELERLGIERLGALQDDQGLRVQRLRPRDQPVGVDIGAFLLDGAGERATQVGVAVAAQRRLLAAVSRRYCTHRFALDDRAVDLGASAVEADRADSRHPPRGIGACGVQSGASWRRRPARLPCITRIPDALLWRAPYRLCEETRGRRR